MDSNWGEKGHLKENAWHLDEMIKIEAFQISYAKLMTGIEHYDEFLVHSKPATWSYKLGQSPETQAIWKN